MRALCRPICLVLAAAAVLAALAAPSAAAPAPVATHLDPEAGVRLTLPFAVAQTKTASQVEALIRHDPARQLPAGARLTGGVYAEGGSPYVVLWNVPWVVSPTMADFRDLAGLDRPRLEARFGLQALSFSPKTLRGLGRPADPGGDGARLILQATNRGFTFVAIHAGTDAEAAEIARFVARKLKVLPEARLDASTLGRGSRPPGLKAAVMLGLLLAAGAVWLAGRRLRTRHDHAGF